MSDLQPNRIPIIRLWHLLLVPLQGDVNDALAERLSEEVLNLVHTTEVHGLVLDVTGLWMMDSHLCAAISRLAQATALMGSKTIICGMTPETAMTLQTMGLDLGGIDTVLSLEQALERQGIAVREEGREDLEDSDDSLPNEAELEEASHLLKPDSV